VLFFSAPATLCCLAQTFASTLQLRVHVRMLWLPHLFSCALFSLFTVWPLALHQRSYSLFPVTPLHALLTTLFPQENTVRTFQPLLHHLTPPCQWCCADVLLWAPVSGDLVQTVGWGWCGFAQLPPYLPLTLLVAPSLRSLGVRCICLSCTPDSNTAAPSYRQNHITRYINSA